MNAVTIVLLPTPAARERNYRVSPCDMSDASRVQSRTITHQEDPHIPSHDLSGVYCLSRVFNSSRRRGDEVYARESE